MTKFKPGDMVTQPQWRDYYEVKGYRADGQVELWADRYKVNAYAYDEADLIKAEGSVKGIAVGDNVVVDYHIDPPTKVHLIAHTTQPFGIYKLYDDLGFENDQEAAPAEDLIEFAGRLCYESYHKPNEKTRANVDYLANVALQKHFSVFEHASATFLIRGVSRALTHELVRHRHFSFSQVSQRYVDSSGRGFVEHEVLNMAHEDFLKRVEELRVQAACLYEVLVADLVSRGYSRKEARGAARLVLPEGTTTDIVVTGNFRSWLEFIEKRDSKFADAEIRALAGEIKRQLQENFPNAFQDSIVNKEETRPEPVSIRPDSYSETYLQQIQEKINQALKDVFK